MSDEEKKATSVVFDHCVSVYDEMAQQAREEPVEGASLGDVQLVYEGHLTKLVTGSLGLATPRYTAVMNHLKAMGCVEQIRRGGGNAPSRWLLIHRPDEESFRSIESMNRPTAGKLARLEQQIRDLNRRVQALESEGRTEREFFKISLNGQGSQYTSLAQQVDELKRQLHNHFGIHHDADQMSEVKT